HLIKCHAKIDMGIHPSRRKFDDVAIILDSLGQQLGLRLAIERGLKKLFRAGTRHGMKLRGRSRIEWKDPLLPDRTERPRSARGDHEHIPAVIEKLKFLQRLPGIAELLLNQFYHAPDTQRRNAPFRQALEGSQGHQIAKAIEALSPARPRAHQP